MNDWKGYRGHLPPPFYTGKDEGRHGRLSEFPSASPSVGKSNYGTGGYYGNTYRHGLGRQPGKSFDYRRLGDHRYADSFEGRRDERVPSGYRSIDERLEISRRHHESTSHKGKGPRSYRRSDARILEDVNERLYDDPFVNASDIETAVQDGEVILSGLVDDRESKRRAEDIAESVSGVLNVQNRLRIINP